VIGSTVYVISRSRPRVSAYSVDPPAPLWTTSDQLNINLKQVMWSRRSE